MTTTDKDRLKKLTKADIEIINEVAKNINERYVLLNRKPRTVFSLNFNNDDNVSGFKDGNNIYKRSTELLNNENKIEEYFKEHPEEKIDKDEFINVLRLFNVLAKSKEATEKEEAIERAERAEREKEEAAERAKREKEEAEREKEEERRQREEAERGKEEIHKAYTGNKEDYRQKLSDKLNENKELRDDNDRLRNRLKEIEKAPLKREYINDKVFNESYSLDKGELMDVISKDINKGKLPSDSDPEEIADAIYAKATRRIYRNLKRINNLTALTGYNPDLYNKLPPEVAEIIKNHITDKIQEDIRKKNIKYILPKDKPRWEKAIEKFNLNPMLGRGAYTI